MRRKLWSFMICVLLGSSIFITLDMSYELAPTVKGTTIYVPNDYPTIQGAINAAFSGDTVFVYSGIYYEHVFINITISLIGEDRNTTIIDSGGIDDGVYVSADWVNVTGFTVKNSGQSSKKNGLEWSDAGIELNKVQNCNIYNNNVLNNRGGIYLYNSSENSVTGNIASNNTEGIQLVYSYQNKVANNTVYFSQINGIFLLHSNINDIYHNTLIDKYSIVNGIMIAYSRNNTIFSNTITKHWMGIKLFGYSNYNEIVGNNISNNKVYGIYFNSNNDFYKKGNIMYHNNFMSNGKHTYEVGHANYWDNGYPSGGNYWSNYCGIDNFKGPNQDIPGSDGIGDTNHSLDFDSKDNYPLMGPYDGTIIITPPLYVLYLKQGWNLISFPLIQNRTDIKTVLQSIEGDYDSVQRYNASDNIDPWKHYKVGKPFGNDLTDLNEKMGFWIHITSPGGTTLVVNGSLPSTPQYILLHEGWNLVGYPSTTSRPRNEALNNLYYIYQIRTIEYYNTTTGRIEKLDKNEFMKPGLGYWVYARSDYVWEVPL